ncbi:MULTISPECIES: DUF1294 domain-containing protein [unclassified Butyrivibrio]|uniref:DUF1294 domain-containing protein n=1 Tax=unclassified Butyrivibrio TaxID=2639466 RepID=UPI0009DB9CFC|nr:MULTISPECIES: DUF1294 domain-containing protein [unclassified Butyrivibrio]
MNSLELIISYLLFLNIVAFLTMGNDKRKSKKHGFRTPESVFFILSVIGGSIGSIAGMFIFRHKTKHWYFLVFLPLILLIQIGLCAFIYMSGMEIVFR